MKTVLVATDLVRARVFRDEAPSGATFPYVVLHDYISDTPRLRGDSVVSVRTRTAQVSLWQKAKDEDDGLVESLRAALDGARLTDAEDHVLRVRVTNVIRLYDEADRTVHHAYDLDVVRVPAVV